MSADRLKKLKKLARRVAKYPESTDSLKGMVLADIGRLAVREGFKGEELQKLKNYIDQLLVKDEGKPSIGGGS